LVEILESYKSREYKESIFLADSGKKLAQVLSKLMVLKSDEGSKDRDQFEAMLRLLHDVMIQQEIKHRKVTLELCSGQRDGQECMNFFFDLINDCAGYTQKYYDEICAGPENHWQQIH
jgi:hypothetical protein